MAKRTNPYNPIDVSIKLGISIEEANVIVAERKARTAGSLENFIRRHGEEEGRKRFEEFKHRSSHTLEKYIEKHGEEEGKKRFKEYTSKKDCRSDSYFKNKYGENWEQERDKTISSWAYKMSLDGYIEKYGVVEGPRLYEEVQHKKRINLEDYIEKYGEDGEDLYRDLCSSKESMSLESHIRRFGVEEGNEKYQERIMRCSPIFSGLKRVYGEALAIEKYKAFKNSPKDVEFKPFIEKCKRKWGSPRKSPVSKQSNKFFDELKRYSGLQMQYGKRKEEFRLFDQNLNKVFMYDCFIPYLGIIIEFNGSAFHYHDSFPEDWVSPYGLLPEDSKDYDSMKKKSAESRGYDVFAVWDFEVSTNSKRTKKIKELIDEFQKRMV